MTKRTRAKDRKPMRVVFKEMFGQRTRPPRSKRSEESADEPPDVPTSPGKLGPDQAQHGNSGNGKAKGPWLEFPLSWIVYLHVKLDREECREIPGASEPEKCEREKVIAGARKHLRMAEAACRHRSPLRKSGTLERIWANIRAADLLYMAVCSDEEVTARSGELLALMRRHINVRSPQREMVENVVTEMNDRSAGAPISKHHRSVFVRGLTISYASLDNRFRRVRILATVLWWATLAAFMGAIGLAFWGAFDKETLDLCFHPPEVVVCPTGEKVGLPKGASASDYVDRLDVFTVEMAGLIGAALTVITSVRKLHDTHSHPYHLALAAAILKFPMGAISALVGLLLIRGAFVPGLSDLDSPAQIIGWAILFGAAQQLVTHIIDRRAEETIAALDKPPPPPPANSGVAR